MLARVIQELEEAGRRYAAQFSGQERTREPARRLAVLTCMDSRIDPVAIFGLELGDANVLRNAGGRVTADVLRSLVLATRILGVQSVVVMHHTDCALDGQTEDSVRARVAAAGATGAHSWRFLAMPDRDAALRDDVDAVRACPLLPIDLEVAGWRYDVATGQVAMVVPHDDD
jgi:carbonic anhydrase